jgi:hypothetical protein
VLVVLAHERITVDIPYREFIALEVRARQRERDGEKEGRKEKERAD